MKAINNRALARGDPILSQDSPSCLSEEIPRSILLGLLAHTYKLLLLLFFTQVITPDPDRYFLLQLQPIDTTCFSSRNASPPEDAHQSLYLQYNLPPTYPIYEETYSRALSQPLLTFDILPLRFILARTKRFNQRLQNPQETLFSLLLPLLSISSQGQGIGALASFKEGLAFIWIVPLVKSRPERQPC